MALHLPYRTRLARAALLALAVAIPATAAPGDVSKPHGFVFWYLNRERLPLSPGACPDGNAENWVSAFLATLNPDDRARLSKRENRVELASRVAVGPHGENLCNDPTAVPDPGLRTIQGGGRAYGMNLDEVAGGNRAVATCPHEKFADGVDNQLERALGCIKTFQAGDLQEKSLVDAYRDGVMTVVMQIGGTDNLKNAKDISVDLYASPAAPPMAGVSKQDTASSLGTPLPNASVDIADDPRYQNHLHGNIVDGVLTTEPADIRLPIRYEHYTDTDYYLRGARIQAEISPNGNVSGMIAGYWDIETFYDAVGHRPGRPGKAGLPALAAAGGVSCPALWYALHRLADGYRDLKTGECTALSTALRFEGVPAFLYRAQDAQKGAADPAKRSVLGRIQSRLGWQ